MRIDDIVNIADAELVNKGFLTDVLAFSDNLKKIKRGSLFISNDKKEIKEAIKKGAYAILFSDNLEVIDNEIAWIKVENINETLLKLLKYKLLNKTLYITDEVTIKIIKAINKDKNLVVLDKIEVNYLNDDYIFITSLDRIKNISANKKEISNFLNIEFDETSIFISKFLFQNKKYTINFPAVYKDKLQKSLSFFEELDLNYQLKNIELNRFIPQFINSDFEKVKFGKTQKVVIQGIKKDKYFMNELNFIFEKLKYANVKFFDKTNIKTFFKEQFDFAVLIDCEVELKEKEKSNSQKQLF